MKSVLFLNKGADPAAILDTLIAMADVGDGARGDEKESHRHCGRSGKEVLAYGIKE